VIKVVRYGLNIQCFPDEHAVELVEKQIAQQQKRRENAESIGKQKPLTLASDQHWQEHREARERRGLFLLPSGEDTR
jgi:hypothetical protein